ncbi:MAG: hypothetical protein IKH88_09910 [Prevotella sp.]|nr:hypothetical protein [Prevotella sp.]MBR7055218.1 hypothetical protein [Prevotella sp.]
MRYPVRKIIRDTRVSLDFNQEETPLLENCGAGNLALDDIIRSKVEMATRHVVQQLDNLLLAPGTPIRTTLAWPGGTPGMGKAVMPLPFDCMRLLCVQLSDWHRPARIIMEDDPEYLWQHTPFLGVGGNPARPVAVICQRPTGWVAELFSSTAGRKVVIEKAQYYPMPRITEDDSIHIPSMAYDDVVRQLASLTAETLGYNTEKQSK